MNSLAIFDIDGTLTNTNSVDDACYRAAVAETMGVPVSAIDWSGAIHHSDRGIFDWVCERHGRSLPSYADVARGSRPPHPSADGRQGPVARAVPADRRRAGRVRASHGEWMACHDRDRLLAAVGADQAERGRDRRARRSDRLFGRRRRARRHRHARATAGRSILWPQILPGRQHRRRRLGRR